MRNNEKKKGFLLFYTTSLESDGLDASEKDPTSDTIVVVYVLEYHNLIFSTHLIIATNSASIFIICLTILSSLQERVGGDKLDGPCDIEPGIRKKLAASNFSLFTIPFTVIYSWVECIINKLLLNNITW